MEEVMQIGLIEELLSRLMHESSIRRDEKLGLFDQLTDRESLIPRESSKLSHSQSASIP